MLEHLLLVFTHPVEGREEEYQDWYDRQHLADVAGLPGFVTGQRYVFDEASPNSLSSAPPFGYLAIYEIGEGHLAEAKAAMAEASRERRAAADEGSGASVQVPGSPALAPGHVSYWFTAIGRPVTGASPDD